MRVGVGLLALASALPAAAQEPVTALTPGQPVAAAIVPAVTDRVRFVVRVPDDAVELVLTVTGATLDLDCFVRYGAPRGDWEADADHAAATPAFNERLRLSRWHEPALRPGPCYVDVGWRGLAPPRIDGARVARCPFTLRADVVPARVTGALVPGTPDAPAAPARGVCNAANGHQVFFTVTVPDGATALRLDLDEVIGDLDLLVRRAGLPLDADRVDHEAATLAGRESLVFDTASQPPLTPGTWHVAVVDRVRAELPVPFALHATLGRAPPPALAAIPPLPVGRTPLERAVFATVQLLGRDGAGSGTLVTPDGWILTNHHVVVRADGTVPTGPDLVVGCTLDPRLPPRECFRAVVRHHDAARDLALCAITSGLYGQPLPAQIRFTPLAFGDPATLAIGDPLSLIGFPDTGGLRSRVSVTNTHGHVAGFERHPLGTLIKTDAECSQGSSGGAALDGAGRLVGLPTETVGAAEGFGQLSFVWPISMVPPEWRALIDAHGKRD